MRAAADDHEARAAALPALEAIMSRAGGENFTVASRLLPAAQREHLLAIYGFARLVDNVGDEVVDDRDALLDELERQIGAIYADREPAHELMRRLAATVRACRLPRQPLDALVAANRQDQHVHRYETFEQLLDYCKLSADPVGRLVLGVFGVATPERVRASDRICTALQLAEHLQDVAEDLQRGRVYVPAEDLARFDCATADLALRPAPERVRRLIIFEVSRARELLEQGAPLVGMLRGRQRVAVAAFLAGGRCALRAIELAEGDVSAGAPRASRPARVIATVAALLAPKRGGRPR